MTLKKTNLKLFFLVIAGSVFYIVSEIFACKHFSISCHIAADVSMLKILTPLLLVLGMVTSFVFIYLKLLIFFIKLFTKKYNMQNNIITTLVTGVILGCFLEFILSGYIFNGGFVVADFFIAILCSIFISSLAYYVLFDSFEKNK